MSSSAGAVFSLRDVVASRSGERVLDGLSLEIGPGATAILGPSGSGKSTLLRLLNRLADPDRGTIVFEGSDVRSLDPLELRRTACLVPQIPALLPGSVADNVVAGARFAGADPPDISRALDLAGLDSGFAERAAGRLSVGEQQRVMLARALALEPRALLLDEPTSALDEGSRSAVEQTLLRLERTLSVTIVLVTHDREQARRLARTTVRIEAGRVVEEGEATP